MINRLTYFHNPIRRKVFKIVGIALLIVGFVIIGAFLSQLVFLALGINPVGSENSLLELEDESEVRMILLLLQGLNTLFVYIFLPLIYIYFFQNDLKRVFLIRTEKLGMFILLSFFIFVTALPITSYLIEFNQQMQIPAWFSELQQDLLEKEALAQKITELIVIYDHWYEIIPILFVVAILAGIGEELLFRGLVQNEICGILKNHHLGIWISAMLFSFIHFQFLGFLPRMALGVLLGYLYFWSENLVVPIFIHIINNAFTFTLLNFYHRNPDVEVSIASPTVILLAIIICGMLITVFYRHSLKMKKIQFF